MIRGACLALALLGLASAAHHPRREDAATPAPRQRFAAPVGVGPRALDPPAGAVVAGDAERLRALLADPAGPAAIWLAARTYHGNFTIHRPVALKGAAGATLEGSGEGTVLDIAADDVLVDNLTIVGSGRRHTQEDAGVKARGRRVRLVHLAFARNLFGASLQMCHSCAIDHVAVRGDGVVDSLRGDGVKLWESDDSTVTDCLVENARDLVVWYSRRVILERNVVRGNRYGTHFMYAHDSVVRDSRLTDNVVGIFVMYSARLRVERNVLGGAHGAAGVGIGFKESDGVQAHDNWIIANTTGIYLDRTPRNPRDPVVFARNVLALDDTAVRIHGAERGADFHDNDFRDNGTTLSVDGGGDALGMTFHGNYWSEYAGYDLDGDGKGDVGYAAKQLTSALGDAHPSLRFFDGTAALALVDVVARAVPVLAARPLLFDDAPRMSPRSGASP